MKIFQRIKFFLFEKMYGKRIYMRAKEWSQNIKNWGLSTWKSYWLENLNTLLRVYPWNKKYYRIDRVDSLEDLLELPLLKDIPHLDYKGKILGKSVSSGTTGKPKVIPFDKKDFERAFLTFRYYIQNGLDLKRTLFVSTSYDYTSGQYFEISKRVIKAGGGMAYHFTLDEIIKGKVKKVSDIGLLTTIFCHILPILRNVPPEIFNEDLEIVLSGDSISQSLVDLLFNELKRVGKRLKFLYNMYGSSEVIGVMAGSNRWNRYNQLEVFPEVMVPFILPINHRKEDLTLGSLKPLWMAKKGEEGLLVITSLRSYLLINYAGLKDYIKVMGVSSGGIPTIYPIGRVGSFLNLGYSNVLKEDLRGYHDIIVRTAGIPLNYKAFIEFLESTFPGSFFVMSVEKMGGVRAEIYVYTNNPNLSNESIIKAIKERNDKVLNLFLLENLEIIVKYSPDFIKEVYFELPNMRSIKGRSPKIVQYIVKKVPR